MLSKLKEFTSEQIKEKSNLTKKKFEKKDGLKEISKNQKKGKAHIDSSMKSSIPSSGDLSENYTI